jgi:hypothetical protein
MFVGTDVRFHFSQLRLVCKYTFPSRFFQLANVTLAIVDLGILLSCMASQVSKQGLQKGPLFDVLHEYT